MKKNMVVERDMKFSQKELEKLGWKDTGQTFADSKIFETKEQALFWNSKTNIVGFMYNKNS